LNKYYHALTLGRESKSILNITWKEAFSTRSFTLKFVIGWILLITILSVYPYFFAYIQERQGVQIDDWLLAAIPPVDFSGLVFGVIAVTTLIGLFRTLQHPYLFLVLLWGYIFLNISRVITILLVPLEPPVGLMPMTDPLAFPFYGQGGSINKDLFYSGHTGTIFLLYLVLQKKWEKQIALVFTILIGVLLLVQHIHYTIDVLCAPLFVYLLYIWAKRFSHYKIQERHLSKNKD
jgi:membrane-associated phospholipid phosphatase